MILKPSMVIPGKACPQQASVDEVAAATIACLQKTVPTTVAGIAFLSGGQSMENSSAHLNAMNTKFRDRCPWPVTFSYARAIQQPALNHWSRKSSRVAEAQKRLLRRAELNSAASEGKYDSKMEQPLAVV